MNTIGNGPLGTSQGQVQICLPLRNIGNAMTDDSDAVGQNS